MLVKGVYTPLNTTQPPMSNPLQHQSSNPYHFKLSKVMGYTYTLIANTDEPSPTLTMLFVVCSLCCPLCLKDCLLTPSSLEKVTAYALISVLDVDAPACSLYWTTDLT